MDINKVNQAQQVNMTEVKPNAPAPAEGFEFTLMSKIEDTALQEKLAEMPMSQARKLQRYLASNAEEVQVDAQGRILLPRHLLAYANIEKEALFAGAGPRAEIWNPAAYEENMSDMTSEEVEAEFVQLGF